MAVLIQINMVAGVKIAVDKSSFTIGRGDDNDLRIDDELASRAHAVIDCMGGKDWILRDKSSTNGTYVNDRRITIHALVDGDVMRIGKTFFKFLVEDQADFGETRILKKTIIPGFYYTKPKSP